MGRVYAHLSKSRGGHSAKRSADPDIESFEHPPPTRPAKNKSA